MLKPQHGSQEAVCTANMKACNVKILPLPFGKQYLLLMCLSLPCYCQFALNPLMKLHQLSFVLLFVSLVILQFRYSVDCLLLPRIWFLKGLIFFDHASSQRVSNCYPSTSFAVLIGESVQSGQIGLTIIAFLITKNLLFAGRCSGAHLRRNKSSHR